MNENNEQVNVENHSPQIFVTTSNGHDTAFPKTPVPLFSFCEEVHEAYELKAVESSDYEPVLVVLTESFEKQISQYYGKAIVVDRNMAMQFKAEELLIHAHEHGCEIQLAPESLYNTLDQFEYLDDAFQAAEFKKYVPVVVPSKMKEVPLAKQKKKEEFLKLHGIRDFADFPLQEYYVEGIIPMGCMVTIYGDSGSGKSFLAADLLAHVASSMKYLGLETNKTKVLYICAEGGNGFRGRTKALLQRFPALTNEDFVIADDCPNFATKKDIKKLKKRIEEAGTEYGIIVVDTMAQVSADIDENSSMVRRVIKNIATLMLGNTTVIIIDHTGKDAGKGIRGHSSKRAALDVTICVERDKAKGSTKRYARLIKAKDDGDNRPISMFNLTQIPIGYFSNGKVRTSCVIDHIDMASEYVPKTTFEEILQYLNDNVEATKAEIKENVEAKTISHFNNVWKELTGANQYIKAKNDGIKPKFALTANGDKALLDAVAKHFKKYEDSKKQVVKTSEKPSKKEDVKDANE